MSSFRKRSVATTQILLTLGMIVTVALQFQNCAGAKFDQDQVQQGQGEAEPEVITDEIFKTLKPALAVRGPGCFTCHSNINASMITDFGHGDSLYRKRFSIYSNYGLRDMNFGSGNTIYIPETGDDLATYLQPQNGSFEVEKRGSIYIGAPTAARLRVAAGGSDLNYQPASAGSPSLSGISGAGGIYTGAGNIQCDGDLFIEGSIHLKSANILTDKGCRLYVTKSVFVTGGLTISNSGSGNDHNLQISAAQSINLGMDDNDITAHYTNNSGGTPHYATPINETVPTRAYPNVATLYGLVAAEANKFNDLTSATTEAGGRGKSMSRLLLNSPRVDSKYTGNFAGSIITEVAMLSMGSFSYNYDAVFTRVPILPKLTAADYLLVK
jgi:hypothetical protein